MIVIDVQNPKFPILQMMEEYCPSECIRDCITSIGFNSLLDETGFSRGQEMSLARFVGEVDDQPPGHRSNHNG